MTNFLGCLFILIFGAVLFFAGIARMVWQMLFGGGFSRPAASARTQGRNPHRPSPDASGNRAEASPGDARHERRHGNSRQRRSGKIFERDEGQYIDFEEV